MKQKFLPSRQKQKSYRSQSPVMVADLDALLTKTVSFRLLGRTHVIEPLSVEEFLEFSAAYAEVISLQDKETVSADELVSSYHKLVSTVCDSVTTKDIGDMTQQQVAALFQIMVDLHTGRLFADEKKTLEKVQALINLP